MRLSATDPGPDGAAAGTHREPDADAPAGAGAAAVPGGAGAQRAGPAGVDQHAGARAGPAGRHRGTAQRSGSPFAWHLLSCRGLAVAVWLLL